MYNYVHTLLTEIVSEIVIRIHDLLIPKRTNMRVICGGMVVKNIRAI